jgi:dihydropteroate synthase
VWLTARGPGALDRPVLVGILNVTPDSFTDGGRYGAVDAALAHAESLLADGADIIDVGGESTRPGRSETVPADEELRRVLPAIEAILYAHPTLLLSVDTVKADVARAALDAGAAIVNDVTALRHDAAMAATVAAARAGVVLMHSRGMLLEIASYQHADYGGDVVGRVVDELRQADVAAAAAGIAPAAVVLDPGFGFAKTVEQNFALLRGLAGLGALGRPILVGPSRKRFLGAAGDLPVERRDRVTAVACALAYERGARLFRVHDVAAAREALAVAHAAEDRPAQR